MMKLHKLLIIVVSCTISLNAFCGILDDTNQAIKTNRMGKAALKIVSDNGNPLRDIPVRIKLVSHDFLFGNYIRPRHYDNEQYLTKFQSLFNAVQLLEFNWGQYEPDEGKPLLKPRMNFIQNWCYPHGLKSFYGHMLVWSRQYGDYPKTGLPLWLFKYDKDKQFALLKARIQREVKDYEDVDIVWDVVNEAVHCRVWGDWEKYGYIQNKTPESMERIVNYVSQALTWAHEANPEAKLIINDYTVIAKSRFQKNYKTLINTLLAKKVPLNGIGIQAHEPNKGKYWYSPEELWQAYDMFGTETGLPIYITEYFNVSDETQVIKGNYKKGHWSPEKQARALEEFTRVSFAHPAVKGIFYFGLSDNDVVIPACGLLDTNFNPKPAWQTLSRLIKQEWNTDLNLKTNQQGKTNFQGFYGKYVAQIQFGDKTVDRSFELKCGGKNEVEFEVK